MKSARAFFLVGRLLFVCLLGTVATCGNDPGHYEDITRVRGLGMFSVPIAAMPSTATTPSTVQVIFVAAAPLGTTVKAAVVSDSEGVGPGTAATMTLSGDPSSEPHNALVVFKIPATITVPTADHLQFIGSDHVATLHYAIQLTSSTAGSEILVGNLLVFEPGASQLTNLVGQPAISIVAPASGATVGNSNQTITANLTQPVNSESFRIGWFTNSGDIDNDKTPSQNRNAATTKWNPKGAGKFTLIVTTRGATSGAFNYDISDVTVQ